MEKYIQLLKKLGFTQEQIDAANKEDSNIDEIAKAHNDKQFELFKAEPEHHNSLKDEAKKKGLAEAFTKVKKALNVKFSLGLQNKDLEELDYDTVLEKAQEKSNNAGTEEVTALNQTIFDLNKKYQDLEDKYSTEKKALEDRLESEKNAIYTDIDFNKQIASKKRIIPEEDAVVYFKTRLEKEGITTKRDDKGNLTFWKGEYQLKNKDNTGFETIESLDERFLGSFVEKSNGSGGAGGSSQQQQEENKDLVLSSTLTKYLEAETASTN
jgi:hypothetical protein